VALSRPATSRATLVFVAAMLAAGCAARPASSPVAQEAGVSPSSARTVVDEVSESDRETFPRSAEALRVEIDERAHALRAGPIGDRAQQLASLRLAATARDLVLSGSPGGALEALRKAVSLFGGNGYAWLFLASVHEAEGRRDEARESAASARRYLPRDEGVQAELDALMRTLDSANTGT
jgi:tetratricopeptide (TPR) repeat protein